MLVLKQPFCCSYSNNAVIVQKKALKYGGCCKKLKKMKKMVDFCMQTEENMDWGMWLSSKKSTYRIAFSLFC